MKKIFFVAIVALLFLGCEKKTAKDVYVKGRDYLREIATILVYEEERKRGYAHAAELAGQIRSRAVKIQRLRQSGDDGVVDAILVLVDLFEAAEVPAVADGLVWLRVLSVSPYLVGQNWEALTLDAEIDWYAWEKDIIRSFGVGKMPD